MSKDLSTLLNGWNYDPQRVNARWITGEDGLPKVQLRLDLGVLQMEMEGRPDGSTPRGYSSLLDYYRDLNTKMPDNHPSLMLNDDACTALQHEAVQYYYRYLAFYALGHLDGVIRDTEHNLDLLELVADHAVDDELAWQFLQFFPYVRMMNARTIAEKAMEQKKYDDAIASVQLAISDISVFLSEYADSDEDWDCDELDFLKEILDKLMRRKPKSKIDKLREDLNRAIANENYEQAAIFRDSLKKLTQHQRIT